MLNACRAAVIAAALLLPAAATAGPPPDAEASFEVEADRGDVAFAIGDYANALRAYSAQANAGDPSAMLAMGVLYDTGHGVDQNFAAALDWYRRAADAGSVSGMFNVATMLDNGIGVPRDVEQAVTWYRRAADQGFGRAAYDLGVIYRDGDGVRRNRAEAIRYFEMAARAGIRAALANLRLLAPASMPETPIPPAAQAAPPSRQTAVLSEAKRDILSRINPSGAAEAALRDAVPGLQTQAAAGDHAAQYDVGWAYQHGEGLSQDDVKAFVYYLRAASAADRSLRRSALQGAAETGAALSPDQHASARTMLLEEAP